MTTINHWGKWVDSEVPITGVYNSNDIAWEMISDEICLDCEQMYKAHSDTDEYNPECENCQECEGFCLDWIECIEHDKLLGDWILDTKTGEYEIDKKGEFSAIENGSMYTIQVVWSKSTSRHALCSPCYPGQGDVDSEGEFLTYTLPDYLLNHIVTG